MLLSLPHEVLQNVLVNVDPVDLAQLSLSCQALHTFIDDNALLFKELYVQLFDEQPIERLIAGQKATVGKNSEVFPKTTENVGAIHSESPARSISSYPWKKELTQLVKLESILRSGSRDVRFDNFEFIVDTTVHLLKVTPNAPLARLNTAFLAYYYSRQINQDTLLCGSSLFEHAGSQEQFAFDEPEHRQMSAKLHCLYGVPIAGEEEGSEACWPYACSRVYDLRNYTANTMWGPFMDDGSQQVDWEKMEVIMVDLNHNIQLFRKRLHGNFPNIWTRPFEGVAPYSFYDKRVHSQPQEAELMSIPRSVVEQDDPYNITGTWMRVVCFLDFRELYDFNFEDELPREGERPAMHDAEEAFRLIIMKLRATSIEPPGPTDGQDLPIVHFTGKAQALSTSWDPNGTSKIRGWVKLTPEGEVRWTTFSVYGGQDRWRSEGIQVGGVQASRGVLGTWFDKDFEMTGPAGPTAFWKISDAVEIEKEGTRYTVL